jgi:membrane-associated protease RseP (regulator of RpoE activity)
MAQIFISYASEDRAKARKLADALADRGWSVWWDRRIPLGKSFDDAIEEALGEAECVIVLWSSVSIASEWVRNEATEAKRRGILAPVFVEPVAAPLAFRLLNGADLSGWDSGAAHPEFEKLLDRVNELVGPRSGGSLPAHGGAARLRDRKLHSRRWGLAAIGIAVLIVAGAAGLHFGGNRQQQAGSARNDATSYALATGFYMPDMGLRIAYFDAQQSVAASAPAGAVVIETNSTLPAGKAGIYPGDIITAVDGTRIDTKEDLRRLLRKIGPARTPISLRRKGEEITVIVECSECVSDPGR